MTNEGLDSDSCAQGKLEEQPRGVWECNLSVDFAVSHSKREHLDDSENEVVCEDMNYIVPGIFEIFKKKL